MELGLLQPIILAIAEQQSLDAVLSSIATSVACQPDVALARVWLRDTDRACPVCARHAATDEDEALHLRASAGLSLDPLSDWSRIDGTFHRIPLSMPQKIAHIAKTGEPIRIDHLDRDDRWVQYPGWAQGEQPAGLHRPAVGLSRRDARRTGSVSARRSRRSLLRMAAHAGGCGGCGGQECPSPRGGGIAPSRPRAGAGLLARRSPRRRGVRRDPRAESRAQAGLAGRRYRCGHRHERADSRRERHG